MSVHSKKVNAHFYIHTHQTATNHFLSKTTKPTSLS